MMKKHLKYAFIALFFFFSACSVMKQLNIFSLEDEKTFGNEMYLQIQNSPVDYPLVNEAKNPELYTHVRRVLKNILNSGQVNYVGDFEWSIQVIDSDVQNAFACPGGKIYVYSGLINFLDNESQLAGVLAHEVAHIHWRHSTRQMTQKHGIAALQQIVLGDNAGQVVTLVSQISGELGGLAFSRSDEYEADATAVSFLSRTEYNPLGVAGFFEKLEAAGQSGGSITFLSTHPSPPDRIAKIREAWVANGSKKGNDFVDRYKDMKKYANSIKR